MKRIIIVLALIGLTGISTIGFAEGGFGNLSDEQVLEKMETRLDKRVAKLTKKLKLTPQQVPKIREALADGQTQIFEIRRADQPDRKAKPTQIKSIRKATRQSVASYLSKDQKSKFAKIRKRHRGQKGFKKMARKLKLNTSQRQQMKAIHKAKRKEMKALRASGASKDELKAKRKTLRQSAIKEFKTILTPKQLKKFKKFKKNRPHYKKN